LEGSHRHDGHPSLTYFSSFSIVAEKNKKSSWDEGSVRNDE